MSTKRDVVEDGPLRNLRVVDLGWYGVDPEATRILSRFGAEVIRVEHESKVDLIRILWPFALNGKPDPAMTMVNAVKDQKFEQSGLFNDWNPGKLGIRLNLATPEGRKVLEELIRVSDVVTENYSHGVMERWGLGYQQLRCIRPDIIYVSMSGMGRTGPDREVKTLGPLVQALCGLTFTAGLPDEEPSGWGFSYMDNLAAYHNCAAVLLAVFHRNRTGQGQYVDAAATEIGAGLTGAALLDFTVNGRPARRPGYPTGNRLEHPAAAPHGVYRCTGDDRWIAIAVFNDDEWSALVNVMGDPAWARRPQFATLSARVAHQDALDEHMNEWTGHMDDTELMGRLQSAGVRAGAVYKGADLESDPQIRHRQMFPELDHGVMGRWPFEDVPIRLSETPGGWKWGAPLLGEDNGYIYQELLGLTASATRELETGGVI